MSVAVVLLVAAIGLVAIAARSGNAQPGDGGAPQLTCDDGGCHGFDRLPVQDGAADYYAGPTDLGAPVVNTRLIDQTVRCVTLNAAANGCIKVEGMAGVGVVTYPRDPTTVAGKSPASQRSDEVSIGTTFADITPAQYASRWAPASSIEATEVRGHPAVRATLNLPGVVWEERPGVLVWVIVPVDRQGELDRIAANVRRVPGPTSIQSLVVVPRTGSAYEANDNNGMGLVVGRLGATECVGGGLIDSCRQDIDERTQVQGTGLNELSVAGSVPTNVVSVRITLRRGAPLIVTPFTFANYSNRFFGALIANDRPTTVEWLDSAGMTVASTDLTRLDGLGGTDPIESSPTTTVD